MNNRISRRSALVTFWLGLLVMGTMGAGLAVATVVSVKLTGAEETPPVTTSATGTAKLTIQNDSILVGVKDVAPGRGLALIPQVYSESLPNPTVHRSEAWLFKHKRPHPV